MATGITSGHLLLADWLFLIGAVVALAAALVPSVVALGKLNAVVALGWLAVCLAVVGWLVL